MQVQKLTASEDFWEKGYEKNHVLMIGDAPGDQKAAEENGVHYYPILVKKEKNSWKDFFQKDWKNFFQALMQESYEEERIREFRKNLSR